MSECRSAKEQLMRGCSQRGRERKRARLVEHDTQVLDEDVYR